jgi:ABC-type polysaccharide/polyol phosphate transport system ATPase subunit
MSPSRRRADTTQPGFVATVHLWKRFKADAQRMLLRDQIDRLTSRIKRGSSAGWRWALRDINLQIEPGESVGLIGANGSGKSTLLKVMTRVMYPYAGRIEVGGRVGALIEVRAGIHPDLTGRENVFLYGTLLGLNRKAVADRFDEIVEFAELANAIDRQVKFYSLGMQMRLGFGVAAFLQPDVLLVDEVLAVGDASFQQRCLDRMGAVTREGATLILVSHDLAAVESTCSRAIWLDRGVMQADGPVRAVLDSYRQNIEESAESGLPLEGIIRLTKAEIVGPGGEGARSEEPLEIDLAFESERSRTAAVFLGISQGTATPIFVLRRDIEMGLDERRVRVTIPALPLPRGRFYLWVSAIQVPNIAAGIELLPWSPVGRFDVAGPDLDIPPRGIMRLAPIHVPASWTVE